MKYAKANFKKRHELEQLQRIYKEPRYLKQRSQMHSAAWKNYFFSQAESNNIANEINRMQGHIDNLIRPLRGNQLRRMKAAKDKLEGELKSRPIPPPPGVY